MLITFEFDKSTSVDAIVRLWQPRFSPFRFRCPCSGTQQIWFPQNSPIGFPIRKTTLR